METTIEKKYIASREQFLAMRAEQMQIAMDVRNLKSALKQHHREKQTTYFYETYKGRRPLFSPREHNIIYGMLKGKSYKQIERYTLENNIPDGQILLAIVDHYQLNRDDFLVITPTQWKNYPKIEVKQNG